LAASDENSSDGWVPIEPVSAPPTVQQPTDLAFAAFVRSLTPEQQSALGDLLEVVGQHEEAFRLF
jgi:hypothetical protein